MLSPELWDVQRSETLCSHLAELHIDLGIACTYRADIIIREVFKLCPGFDTTVRFATGFIIDVAADGTDIFRRVPFFKSPLTDLPFSLKSTDRTYVIIR